jgi:hypothetical protein
VKLDALDHPKTLDFAARLNINLPTAIGHLELLWAWAGKKAAQGNIGKWPDGAIARACFFDGDPATFVAALVAAGFLDPHPTHRLLVHDWLDHAPRWVKSKLSTEGQTFICADIAPGASEDVSGDTSHDSKGREGKGSEGKPTAEADAGPAVERLPLADGSEYPIHEAQVIEWQRLFPALDVPAKLREIRAWNLANPKNRKTRKGVERHIVGWLTREQDRARPGQAQRPVRRVDRRPD